MPVDVFIGGGAQHVPEDVYINTSTGTCCAPPPHPLVLFLDHPKARWSGTVSRFSWHCEIFRDCQSDCCNAHVIQMSHDLYSVALDKHTLVRH